MADNLLQMAQPASTGVHSNIDNLLLQSEMNNKFYGKVGEFRGKKEYPINMLDYANLMSKANISSATSKLGEMSGGLNIFVSDQDLKKESKNLLSKMRMGDSPGGIVAYRSTYPDNTILGQYFPAKNTLMAPDTIRLFQHNAFDDKTKITTALHEPLHGMSFSDGFKHLSGLGGKIAHYPITGLRQEDFDVYEKAMIRSLSDYFGDEDTAVRKAMELLGAYPKQDAYERYVNLVTGYEPIKDILKQK